MLFHPYESYNMAGASSLGHTLLAAGLESLRERVIRYMECGGDSRTPSRWFRGQTFTLCILCNVHRFFYRRVFGSCLPHVSGEELYLKFKFRIWILAALYGEFLKKKSLAVCQSDAFSWLADSICIQTKCKICLFIFCLGNRHRYLLGLSKTRRFLLFSATLSSRPSPPSHLVIHGQCCPNIIPAPRQRKRHFSSPCTAFTSPRGNGRRHVEAGLYLKTGAKCLGGLNLFKLNGWHPGGGLSKMIKKGWKTASVWTVKTSRHRLARPAPRARKLISISAQSNLPSPERWS